MGITVIGSGDGRTLAEEMVAELEEAKDFIRDAEPNSGLTIDYTDSFGAVTTIGIVNMTAQDIITQKVLVIRQQAEDIEGAGDE